MTKPGTSLQPVDLAGQYTNQGVVLFDQGRPAEALACYRQAIQHDPNFTLAYYNMGLAHYALGQDEPMWQFWNIALGLAPRNTDILLKIAIVCKRKHLYLKAIEMAQRAIEAEPELQGAWISLADSYRQIGNAETARRLYERLVEKFPKNPVAKMELAWLLPPIPASQEEMDTSRAAFMDNLDRLMQQGFTAPVPNMGQEFPFFQTYHARNTVALMTKLAQFFLQCCPEVRYTAPHCAKPFKRREKIRVGFVSHMLETITLNQFFLSLIEYMGGEADFEIIMFSPTSPHHETAEHLSKRLYKYKMIPTQLAAARTAIAAEEVDILIYQELGLSNQAYYLALARLAPIQCLMVGHPTTSGIPTVDYFLTAKVVEPENCEEHYTEKPALTERLAVMFQRPPAPAEIQTRQALGLPGDDVRLYLCPVMPFKIHPDMDRVFAAILARDPKARILLIDAGYKTLWNAQLQARFAAAMPTELCQRISFLPFVPQQVFFQILRVVDAVLDSFHYSFGTVAYHAFGMNVPFVTWPGEFFRGRMACAMYKRMDMPDLVAATHDDYVDLAIKLANDKAFHEEIAEKIRNRSDVIFNDVTAAGEFAACLKQLYADGPRS